jgi:hypothetical protein
MIDSEMGCLNGREVPERRDLDSESDEGVMHGLQKTPLTRNGMVVSQS